MLRYLGLKKQLTFLFFLPLLLYSCDIDWDTEVVPFIEDGLSYITLGSVVDSETSETISYIPSTEESTVQLNIYNPQELTAICTVTVINDDFLDTELSLEEDSDSENTLYLTVDPSLEAEHEAIEFMLNISSPEIERDYDTVYFSLNCDTPPNSPQDISVSTTDENYAQVNLTLPSEDTDDDLDIIEVTYYLTNDTDSITSFQVEADDENYLSEGGEENTRSITPPDILEGESYVFSVLLYDESGQTSDSSDSGSDPGNLTITITFSDREGSLSFDSDAITCNTGTTVSFEPDSAELEEAEWAWFVNGTEQDSTTSSFSYSPDETGQYTISCSAEYDGYLYGGSVLVTVVDQPSVNYSGNGGEGTLPDAESYDIGDTVTVEALPEDLSLDGYSLTGYWNSAADGSGTEYAPGDSFTMDTESLILFAQWEEGEGEATYYTVSFDGNGGSGTMADQSIAENSTDTLTANSYSLTDHSFAGWSLDPKTELLYTDEGEYTMGSEDITLYALWSYNYDLDDLSGYDEMISLETAVDQSLLASTYLPGIDGLIYEQATGDATGFNHYLSSFDMGSYEVSYELWYTVRTWAQINGYSFANLGCEGSDGTEGEAPTEDELQPVTTINWRDALIWCNAYSEMSGLTPCYYVNSSQEEVLRSSSDEAGSGEEADIDEACVDWEADGYRLPSEGEWQYAASCAGTYGYSETSGSETPVYNTSSTADVGTAENDFALFDMNGNVSEWCFDWYAGSSPETDQINYRGSEEAQDDEGRVYKGGSYSDSTLSVGDFSYEESISTGRTANSTIGFRVVQRSEEES
ncbi:MAG: SUMF1/EgtB/PvdO family nonheme iron enzyme [Spirochaetales bacterium]|nr:SUMF1/EgtB/PvdO family nonheme iron enzyme [Spirochaetales bacterium]